MGRCLLKILLTDDNAAGETRHMIFSTEGPHHRWYVISWTGVNLGDWIHGDGSVGRGGAVGQVVDGLEKNRRPHKL